MSLDGYGAPSFLSGEGYTNIKERSSLGATSTLSGEIRIDNEGLRPRACTYAESAPREMRKELEQKMAERCAELMRAGDRLQKEVSCSRELAGP